MLSKIKKIEEDILSLFAKIQTPLLNKIMVFFTVIGNGGTIWLLISIPLLVNYSSRIRGIKLIISLALAGFLGEIII